MDTFCPSCSSCTVGRKWGAAESCVTLRLASRSQPSKLYCQSFNCWLLNVTVAFGLDVLLIKSVLYSSLQCHLLAGSGEPGALP